ncbi:SusC/RagA family TonB-linked outer membrane protein [Bacteroidia bacterium]|nr:SusC/RagA family TonB-linked outer membrane protein [Bacteroidia bacterium]
MKKITHCWLAFTLLVTPLLLQAQQDLYISGMVTDGNSEPVIGATVVVKGTSVGTSTGINGDYNISAPTDATLVFSFIGMGTHEERVGGRARIDVHMSENTQEIDEVVVVGYGTVKKSTMVGAVGTISSKEIEKRPVTSVGAVLYGASPGLLATSATGIPGDDPSVRIRGFGTVNSSSAPITVVDGAIFELSLRTINPQDIESISILKDAAATAIYGARGANGVIMITTKKGRNAKPTFTVNVLQGFNMRFLPEMDKASPQDYYQLMYEASRNSMYFNSTYNMDMSTANQFAALGGTYHINEKDYTFNSIYQELGSFNPFYGIDNNEIIDPATGQLNPAATRLKWGDDLDWMSPMAHVGKRSDISLSAGGGTDKSDYYLSLNYLNDEAWMKRSFTNRMSARANINFSPTKWLRLGTNLSGSLVNSFNASWAGDGTDNPFYTARNMGSIYPVHLHNQITGDYILDANGNPIYDVGGQIIDGVAYPRRIATSGNRNVVAELFLNDAQYKRVSLQTRSYVDFLVWDGIKVTLSANIGYSPYSGHGYTSNKISINPDGRLLLTERTNASNTYQQLVAYDKTFAEKHSISVVAGHESFQSYEKQVSTARQGQITDGNPTDLPNYTTISTANSTFTELRSEGYLSRVNYSYDQGLYSIEGSYRRDGTSKFYRDVRWGNFWSVGAGWNIAREGFMKVIAPWVDILKLRSSYGTNGNLQGIGNYNWQDVYMLNHNNQSEPGYLMDPSEANRALTWEKQSQFSIAFDYAFLKSRIKGSVEYFDKSSLDLLFNVRQPASTGMTLQPQNIGSLYNRGWEFEISGDVIRTSTLTWNVGLTAATLTNRITKMPEDNPELISGSKKLMAGHSIYDFWLREYYGVDPRDGAPVYHLDPAQTWTEGTCRIMADGTQVTTDVGKALYNYVGTSIPDLYGTVSTAVYWQGFSLSLRFGYQIGGKVYDNIYANLTNAGRFGYAIHADMMRRWQQPGDVTDIPRMDNANYSIYTSASTRYLKDASYLTLNTATLSYSFQSKVLEKLRLSALGINLSGENLLLFSSRKGLNPMESFAGTTSQGYSPSRVITLGLNLTF